MGFLARPRMADRHPLHRLLRRYLVYIPLRR